MKTVAGLDVHKDSVYLCILRENGEKIERVYGYFMLYGGQSEHFPQVVGDERSVVHGFGQHPFVDG